MQQNPPAPPAPPAVSAPTDEEETIFKDPVTGAEKAEKLARYDLLPVRPLRWLAEHYGKGARKYEDRNWEKGYPWSKSFAAMLRHAWRFWGGEDFDSHTPTCAKDCTKHTGSHHLTAVAWHAFAMLEFTATHPERDDRPA